MDRQRLYDVMMGLAIGDAVGVPAEFKSRWVLQDNPILDMIGYCGVWNKPKGTWSDDTSMALASLDALNKNNWIVNEKTLIDTMDNFVKWYKEGAFTSDGDRFDIGNTCREALSNYINHGLKNCGINHEYSCGNGALMRIAPLAFTNSTLIKDIAREVSELTKITHAHDRCIATNVIYITYLRLILKGVDKVDAYKKVCEKYKSFDILRGDLADNIDSDTLSGRGFCVSTLNTAIWAVLSSESYKECILKAINIGDDTDTTAAVAGALAGAVYGIKGIPQDWVDSLINRELIEKLCNGGTD